MKKVVFLGTGTALEGHQCKCSVLVLHGFLTYTEAYCY